MNFNSRYGIPHPSRHARERYVERARDVRFRGGDADPESRDVAIAVLDAWDEGIPLERPHGRNADSVRYNPKLRIVLCRRDTDITTVLSSQSARKNPVTNDAIKKLLKEHREGSE